MIFSLLCYFDVINDLIFKTKHLSENIGAIVKENVPIKALQRVYIGFFNQRIDSVLDLFDVYYQQMGEKQNE